ncbi:MAG: hypothetical protein K6F53_08700 [Lachnospiraceae bacterium]|nr:hypothetical protein [Lachnospiraceae bacterium]
MKKALIKAIIVLAVFLTSAMVTSRIINKDSLDMTSEMTPASFPVVCMQYGDTGINRMFGYTMDMELNYMRSSITPLMPGRKILLKILLHENYLSKLSYEIRTLDGLRLIENTEITDYEYGEGTATAELTVKDLIESDREYEMIVCLETVDGKKIDYYTRIINPTESHVEEKLNYVADFSAKTFHKGLAEDLIKYLESDSQGDNSSFGHVNIHSSFEQVTWGELSPLRVTEPMVTIKEITPATGNFLIDYYVSVNEPDHDIRYFKVREFYRIRYTKERMYLLDFERTMDEVFLNDKAAYSEETIMLGIRGEETVIRENEDGSCFAFVAGGNLYAYDSNGSTTAYLFGFNDGFSEDERIMNDEHAIRIMNVDEAGNVTFLIYGYMSRGLHEGECGVAAYRYDASVNTIEELAYIPVPHSPDLLMREVEKLSYMNTDGNIYLLIGDTLYGIHSGTRSVETVAEDLTEGDFFVTKSERIVAFRRDNGIRIFNFESGKVNDLEPSYGQQLKLISFIGEDLVYGVFRTREVTRDGLSGLIEPMFRIVIYNSLEGEIMSYSRESDGIYIRSGEVRENQIILKRLLKNEEDGTFEDTTDDQIMNSADIADVKNTIDPVAVEIYETLTRIFVHNGIDAGKLKFLHPKFVLFEEDRKIALNIEPDAIRYTVYGKYGVDSFYNDEQNAVMRAYNIAGSSINFRGDYIFRKGVRSAKNQIMAITEAASDEDRGSLAVCLDTMLEYEGQVRNSQYMLDHGQNAIDILEDALIDYEVLDLNGVSLDAVLYYVNRDIPVLVRLEDGNAMLLIGFNESNTVVMDPTEGEIRKIGMEDSETLFGESGNSFVTYVKKAD